MPLTTEGIKSSLKQVKYPGFSRDIVSFGIVNDIEVVDSKVRVSLLLPKPDDKIQSEITESVRKVLSKTNGISDFDISVNVREQKSAPGRQIPTEAPAQPGIKHFIAVASGKGGVGKSTVAVNIAIEMSKLVDNVGLMDADVYGPSIPIMLGVNSRPQVTPEKKIIPIEKYGLKLISIGFLVNEDDAVIWRGPMVHGAIKQFIEDVQWEGTDFLVIDLPPGTGDAHLSLIQAVPLSGALIVTTPQEVALIDVKRGVQMFRKLNVPIIGIVENMSYLITPGGETVDIFGRGGGRRIAEKFEVPFLGEIPIDPQIRKGGDQGTPITLTHADSSAAKAFREISKKVLSTIQ